MAEQDPVVLMGLGPAGWVIPPAPDDSDSAVVRQLVQESHTYVQGLAELCGLPG